MANEQNLTPVQPGQVLNPNGRPKGSPNRKTILNFLLFEADLETLGIEPTNKPAWWDKVKPKNLYEAMTMAMAINAMSGDNKAFNSLNRALGEYQIAEQNLNVVHIFKPEKSQSIVSFNEEGDALRKHNQDMLEGEVIDEYMEIPTRPSDDGLTSSR